MKTLRIAQYLRTATGPAAKQKQILDRAASTSPNTNLVATYTDVGVSGLTPFAERSGGRRLLADVRSGLVDEVWITDISRLGRDAADVACLVRELARLDIPLVAVPEMSVRLEWRAS